MNRGIDDPDVYPGTDVLRNFQDIRDASDLEAVEASISALALIRLASESLPGRYDFEHFAAFHRALFEDLYPFAGQIRNVPLTKPEISLQGRSVAYAAPANVRSAAEEGLTTLREGDWSHLERKTDATQFATAVAVAWQAHPFRDGNTRTTMALVRQLAKERGSPLDFGVLSGIPNETRNALAIATEGNADVFRNLIIASRRAEIERAHPVLGRMTSEAREVLELLGSPEIRALVPGAVARGKVLTTSYQTVLLQSGAGITAIGLRNFDDIPINDTRVTDLAVRYAIGSTPKARIPQEGRKVSKSDGPGH